MPRVMLRFLSLLLGLVPSLLGGPLRADDAKASDPPPKGEVTKYSFDKSKIFPGTVRDYWIYVPRQYDPAKPACLYVCQDGVQYKAPQVFDELIHKKEMPVTIGVFVTPGRVKAPNGQAMDRFNRSYEYDGLGDNYVRFLLEELLPEVETKKTADGRPIRLSRDGNDRCIAGASSGAICAFTAAWERPDSFRRVFSAIGTYVGLRGGNVYPTLIRKSEPKPIRVFLQDGSSDLNIYGGDWWMANQEMERALIFAGYEVNHDWGTGGHSGEHATRIFPDAMRWLWKDWPRPVKAGAGSQQIQEILRPDEGWTLVAEGYRFTEGPAANEKGEVFFNDIPNSKAYKIDLDGKVSPWLSDTKQANGQAFGPDGRLYAAAANEVLAYDAAGKPTVIAEGFHGNDLVVRHDGGIYVTNPVRGGAEPSKVWYISPKGEKRVVDTGLELPQRHRALARPDAALRRRLRQPLGLQLPGPAGRLAGVQAEVLPPARARHRRRRRRRRDARRPPGPALRGDPHGHPGLRPARPGQRDHPHAQRPDRQPLLRRAELRHPLRHLRRPRLPAQGQDPGRQRLPGPDQAADTAVMRGTERIEYGEILNTKYTKHTKEESGDPYDGRSGLERQTPTDFIADSTSDPCIFSCISCYSWFKIS